MTNKFLRKAREYVPEGGRTTFKDMVSHSSTQRTLDRAKNIQVKARELDRCVEQTPEGRERARTAVLEIHDRLMTAVIRPIMDRIVGKSDPGSVPKLHTLSPHTARALQNIRRVCRVIPKTEHVAEVANDLRNAWGALTKCLPEWGVQVVKNMSHDITSLSQISRRTSSSKQGEWVDRDLVELSTVQNNILDLVQGFGRAYSEATYAKWYAAVEDAMEAKSSRGLMKLCTKSLSAPIKILIGSRKTLLLMMRS